jgi:UDP-N-acetylglucosamine 2-epimerase (non-hydrolysing)
MNILVCYGTRPEYIKVNPLISEFGKQGMPFKTLCIKQHTSLLEGSREADYTVWVPEAMNRLDRLLGAGMHIPDKVFEGITHVLVQGDTATALACAMSAFHRDRSVIHLEAGLRTQDKHNPYPEEVYRQMISRIADIHLCPTTLNEGNLINEGVTGHKFVCGNTVLDGLLDLRSQVTVGTEVLVTLHRRENQDLIHSWFDTIDHLGELYHDQFTFTLPIHPSPQIQRYRWILKNINVVEPMDHESFIKKLASCAFAITDSGGIQEEASFLGKAVIVCRKITERPETVGTHSFLCPAPSVLPVCVTQLLKDGLNKPQSDVYGDGHASEKIAQYLKDWK